MKRTAGIAVIALLLASAALAHQGVKIPIIKARMALMGDIRQATAVIGDMVKGQQPHDVSTATEARAALLQAAQAIPAHFSEAADDPKSEALPAVWETPEDFNARAAAMVEAVTALDVGTLPALRSGLKRLGETCSACHKSCRVKK